jgi:hypothetical protein
VRALEERGQLMRRIGDRARTSNRGSVKAQFEEEAEQAEQQARVLRDAVTEYASRGLSVLSGSEGESD